MATAFSLQAWKDLFAGKRKTGIGTKENVGQESLRALAEAHDQTSGLSSAVAGAPLAMMALGPAAAASGGAVLSSGKKALDLGKRALGAMKRNPVKTVAGAGALAGGGNAILNRLASDQAAPAAAESSPATGGPVFDDALPEIDSSLMGSARSDALFNRVPEAGPAAPQPSRADAFRARLAEMGASLGGGTNLAQALSGIRGEQKTAPTPEKPGRFKSAMYGIADAMDYFRGNYQPMQRELAQQQVLRNQQLLDQGANELTPEQRLLMEYEAANAQNKMRTGGLNPLQERELDLEGRMAAAEFENSLRSQGQSPQDQFTQELAARYPFLFDQAALQQMTGGRNVNPDALDALLQSAGPKGISPLELMVMEILRNQGGLGAGAGGGPNIVIPE